MDERTKRFLDEAVDRKWLTHEQVEECIRVQETVREVGVEQKIEEILVRKGYLSPARVRVLHRDLSEMRVGKYQILERLGEGGAGIVYRANQEPLERVVALKVLSRQRAENEKFVERFLREARIAVTLNHQNIVRGLDYGEVDGYHYFVMEYVEGDSLFEILAREGTLEERRAFDLALQTTHALQHAARYDLVHRDIKPENILVTPDGTAKLCDLGLAKPSLVETAQTSRDGTTIGTPTYMSPEQIRGKDETDFRADVYSLGATLYHMVTGRPPFLGASADILVRQHLRTPVTDPRERNPSLSSSAAAVILKMLAKQPEDRYPSLDALEEDLKAVLDGRPPRHTIQLGPRRPASRAPVELGDAATPRSRRFGAKKRSFIPLIVLVCVLAAVGGAVMILKPFVRERGPAGPRAGAASGTAEAPMGRSPGEKAEDLFYEAKDFEEQFPTAAWDSLLDRYRLVVKKYPDTRWAVSAKDHIRAIEARREQARAHHRLLAKKAYEALLDRVTSFTRINRYGDALKEFASYPAEFADTEFPEKLERDRERTGKEAAEKSSRVLDEADGKMRMGRYEEAVKTLEALAGIGMPDIEEKVRRKVSEIRAAEKAEREARVAGRAIFLNEVGKAFVKAAEGAFHEAETDLLQAAGRRELSYYQHDLDEAEKDLRRASRFTEALPNGARSLAGKVERFNLLRRARGVAAGKVLGAGETGIVIQRGTARETVPFSSIAPLDRIRIAFQVLNRESPEDHRDAALYLILNGFFPEADAEIEAAKVLGVDPKPLEARRNLFEEYLRSRADVDLKRALALIADERLPQARELLEKTAARTPLYDRPYLLLGRVLVEMGRPGDAREALDRARELFCRDPALDYYLGEANYALKEPEEALKAFTRYVQSAREDDPHLVAARDRIQELRDKVLSAKIKDLEALARAAYRKKHWEDAVRLYRRIRELSPDRREALYYEGKALLAMGRIKEGYRKLRDYLASGESGRRRTDARRQVRSLERDYRDNPKSTGLVTDGLGAYGEGDYDKAVDLFTRALAVGPLNADAYYDRGLAYLEIGKRGGKAEDYESALADFEAVRLIDPKENLALEGRALALYYLGRYEEALAAAELTIEKVPGRWQSYNIAGLVHHVRRRDEQALRYFTQGIEKAPDCATLYINRALAFEGLERYEEARADLKTAMAKNPTGSQIASINEILARILKK